MVNWLKFKYSWAPFLSALVWAGTLIALFVLWRVDGPPVYKQNRTIIYISYAGAKWKALFVAGAAVTSLFYVITLILDVELRRHERIPAFLRRREAAFSLLSIITGTIAAISLVLLASLDVHNFHTEHWIFTTVFIVGVFFNGVFNLFEIKYLSRGHFQLGYLRRNAYAKLAIATVALICAIIFGILQASCSDGGSTTSRKCNPVDSTAAVFEWAIAVLFVGFLLTYVIDFRAVEAPPPALRAIQAGEPIQMPNQEQQMADIENQTGNNVVPPPQASLQQSGPKPPEPAVVNPQVGSAVA